MTPHGLMGGVPTYVLRLHTLAYLLECLYPASLGSLNPCCDIAGEKAGSATATGYPATGYPPQGYGQAGGYPQGQGSYQQYNGAPPGYGAPQGYHQQGGGPGYGYPPPAQGVRTCHICSSVAKQKLHTWCRSTADCRLGTHGHSVVVFQ